jgi:NAD dependent epimerase/dehydratase
LNWNRKKILVTGAGGFIGSHLCEVLMEAGADVTALVRYNSRNDWGNLEFLPSEKKSALTVILGDIEDSDLLSAQVKGKEIIFHLAALIGIPYSYSAPGSYIRTNVQGTLNVMEAARRRNVEKVIHTSTSEVYGTAQYTPIDEKHPLRGQSPYSASKISADKVAESYAASFDLPVTIIRPFNTYGPRQSARAIIPTIIAQALTQEEVKLGLLDPVRDLTFVGDTVRAFVQIAEASTTIGETINIGTGRGVSIAELADSILKMQGLQIPVVLDPTRVRPKKSEVYKLICDNSKAKQLLNWEPIFSLTEGLKETIQFVSDHLNIYKPSTYNL